MSASPVNRLEPHWPQTPAYAPTEQTSWRETAKSWEEQIEDFMGDHPKLTLAAAASIGVLLGWMVKRK